MPSSFAVDDKILYCYTGWRKQADLLKVDKKNEDDLEYLSTAEIKHVYEEPGNGKWAKTTAEATKKNPYYRVRNIRTGKTSCVPAYVILRHLSTEEEEALESEKSSGSETSKKKRSNTSSSTDESDAQDKTAPSKKKVQSK